MQRQRGQNKWRHERKWISVVALVSSGFCGAAKPTWTREGAVRAAERLRALLIRASSESNIDEKSPPAQASKATEGYWFDSFSKPICMWTRYCTMLHVMIFFAVQNQRKCENQLHVMIAVAISKWTRCCTMLHVMIHVLALVAIQNPKS